MKFAKTNVHVYQYLILLIGLSFSLFIKAQETKFTVVLDAGHGGHDPGAMGAITREKDINLAVTLELGSLIEKNFKDVRVIYTRKTDKYLTLPDRADVANNNHADLFICVHTNSSPSSLAFGAETYTLGLAKTKANLDVAMRENSVILLEEDYKTKYKGFDPNSVDSYIMFEFMQDKYIDKSVELSSLIQKQFVNFHRSDRGVRQAGFWVLHRSACPSVLVEVGFISNAAEERFLNSESGRKEIASAIFNAFVDYKRAHDKKSGYKTTNVSKIVQNQTEEAKHDQVIKPIEVSRQSSTDTVIKVDSSRSIPTTTTKENNYKQIPVFKVQLFASNKVLKSNSPDFKGISNVDCFKEGSLNKYTLGSETEYSKIEKIRKSVLSKFPEAFIIAFIGDKKMTAKEALKLKKY